MKNGPFLIKLFPTLGKSFCFGSFQKEQILLFRINSMKDLRVSHGERRTGEEIKPLTESNRNL
jgi:hypothetical protein